MHASSTPLVYRHTLFSGAKPNASFVTDFETSFKEADVQRAADMLSKASDAEHIGSGAWDLGAWMATPPEVADKLRFVHKAIQHMPRHRVAAADALIHVLEELANNHADTEHVPAAFDYMLHASTHEWWVSLLLAQPSLLSRYCALLGKGADAARAFCMLAKHMAGKEDTSSYAWEVWQRSVDVLDHATRLQITTHIRAIDRPVFNGKQHSLYRQLALHVSDQRSFKTLLPTYRFIFPGSLSEQERCCDWALLAFVHNAGRHIGRKVELKEFDGIRRVRTGDGRPCIEVFYSTFVAQTVRLCMGIGLGKTSWPMESEMQSMITQVRAEFARQWLDIEPLTITRSAGSLLHHSASRQEYAAVIQQLSAHNLLIGETHRHYAGINFVIQNMRWLRETGYTVLYLEGMPAEAQGLANDFLSGKPMAAELSLIHASEFVALLQMAKKTGMPVVFLDTDLVNPLADEDLGTNALAREAPFNAFACDLIEDDAVLRGGGKFIALLGGVHLGGCPTATSKVWGMQHRLPSCKSLFLCDLPPSNSVPNFVIVSDEVKQLMNLHPDHVFSALTADVYIAASHPTQMSIVHDASDGVRHRSIRSFERPPGTLPR